MNKMDLTEKNKNMLLNMGILLLAGFIAFNFFKTTRSQISELNLKKDNEIKKNQAMEEIAGLEVKVDRYKKIFPRKDISYALDAVSRIAKNSGVQFVSIKPMDEETNSDYIRSSFLITVNSNNYHSLANFISQIESDKDIYFVNDVSITASSSATEEEEESQGKPDLTLNLKISTISINNE